MPSRLTTPPSNRTLLLRLHRLRIPLNPIERMPHTRNETVQTHVRRVDRAFAREQQRVVEEAAERAAEEGGDHGDLCVSC